MPGLFDNIVKVGDQVGTVQDNLNRVANDPIVLGVKKAISLLPAGELKNWVSANPVDFWKKVIQIFKGRKYTKGDYRIVERYWENVLQDTPLDNITNTNQIPDDAVPEAQQMLSFLFGVRVRTSSVLDALQRGVDAYYQEPGVSDIPLNAVKRAVFLKQTFFPDSTYNNQKWDLSNFEKFPLVAPIPGIDPGTLYTGPLPGGAMANNGVIPADYQIQQILSQGSNPDYNPNVQDGTYTTGSKAPILIGAAAVVIILIIVFKN